MNAPGFVPYVYGATLGTPSKGRPGKVAEALRDAEVLPAGLAAVPDGPPSAALRAPLKPCGTMAACRRHLRAGEAACEACAAANREHARAVGRRVQAAEDAERARLDAARCPECRALPPNHMAGCGRQKLPDPDADRCWCGYVKGSLGCRMTHGSAA